MAFFTYSNVNCLSFCEPKPWDIICYCMNGANWCWYFTKTCYVTPIFIMIYCWRFIPIYWIWVIPLATIFKYWSKFWLRFYLLNFFLSFLKLFENLKIYFLEKSSENTNIFLTSYNEGFAILIVDFNLFI